jgi:hypothetical protein
MLGTQKQGSALGAEPNNDELSNAIASEMLRQLTW